MRRELARETAETTNYPRFPAFLPREKAAASALHGDGRGWRRAIIQARSEPSQSLWIASPLQHFRARVSLTSPWSGLPSPFSPLPLGQGRCFSRFATS